VFFFFFRLSCTSLAISVRVIHNTCTVRYAMQHLVTPKAQITTGEQVFVHVRVQCPIHIMKQSKESVQLKRDRTEAGTIRYKAILTSCYTTPGCSGCRLRCPLSWPSSGCLSGGSAFVYSITRRHWDLALSRGTGPFHHPRRIRLQPRSSRDIQSDMQSDFGHHDRRRAQALIARGPRTNLFYLGRCPFVTASTALILVHTRFHSHPDTSSLTLTQ